MSHDLLDDLLDDVPRHVTADPAAAWRAGTGRRRRRYAAEAVAVAAAVALVGLGLVRLHDHTPVQPVGPTKTVDGYPRDVPRPFFGRDVPAAPGPAAGVVMGDGEWELVTAGGQVWRLPDVDDTPVLSDDGVRLAVMRSDGPKAGHLEVRNLVTGAVESYADVGTTTTGMKESTTGQRFWTSMRSAAWSPDGARLVLLGGSVGSRQSAGLVLEDGRVSTIPPQDQVLGWTSPSTIAWLSYEVHGNLVTSARDVVVTDLEGQEVSRVRLQARPRLEQVDEWGARLSPDGSRLAVLDNAEETVLRVFSLDTGSELPSPARDHDQQPGPPVWRGDDVLWWHGTDLVDPASGRTVVSLAGRWGGYAIIEWAQQSLAGPAHDGPSALGWRYWPVWWWWKKILVGLGVALGALGLWVLDRWDTRKHLRAT
jgi:hypothetical protein